MKKRSRADLLGEEPSESEKAKAAIAERAAKFGDNNGHVLNANAFAERFAGRVLFVPERNEWFEFDGDVWAPNAVGFIMQGWAAEREQVALEKHMKTPDSPKTKFNLQHARMLLHSLPNQARTLEAASQRPEMRRPIRDFDQHPMLLPMANGVLDLAAGALIASRPNLYLMRRAPVTFNAEATCPEFMAYLERVQPDPDMRRMMQRLAGYTLTGDVSEEKFVFCHGDGANGKSVFLDIMSALLGDFAVNIPGEQLTKFRHGNVDVERIGDRLVGARLALSNEVPEGAVWNEPLMKQLASYDRMSARPYYSKAYDFTPSHTLWVRANYVPGSFDSSDGLVRRYLPVGFNVKIADDQKDEGLPRRIIANELSGVLNWALAGARMWARDRRIGLDGLAIPQSVKEERAAYKEDSDWFGRWLAERTLTDAGAATATNKLYESYRSFCQDGGVSPPSLIAFGKIMQARKFRRLKADARNPSRYSGVRLVRDANAATAFPD